MCTTLAQAILLGLFLYSEEVLTEKMNRQVQAPRLCK